MKAKLVFVLFNFLIISTFAQKNIKCVIKTSLGDIEAELYAEKAPATVANFLKYVDVSLYDGSSFFRTCTPENEKERKVKIEVIQGGNVPEGKEFAPITIETTRQTGLKHLNGTLSMARSEPNTATSSFFICINNQPELDFAGKRNPDGQGFAAFGQVTKGMDVVKIIQAQKDEKQYLIAPVEIYSIKRQ